MKLYVVVIEDMSARKGSISGGSSVIKRQSPIHNDTEYTAAVAVLSEANMSRVCELLLSEKDYDSDQSDGHESDHQKLLQLFSKCEAACKVIQQRAPAVLMPTLQRGPAPAARAQAKPLKPKVKTMLPPRRGSLMTQTSRASLKTGPPASLPPPTRKVQRETSESSIESSSGGSAPSAKKARLSPLALGTPLAGVLAPPPAAMSFLAALNAQQQKREKQEKEETRESSDEDKEPPTRKARSMSPPPPPAGERRQPPRNARKG